MHVAAANPTHLSEDSIDLGLLNKDIWIEAQKSQAVSEGKPEAIATKIAEGKWRKWCKENVLTEQTLATREGKETVSDIISILSQAAGEPIYIHRFLRLELGV